VTKGPDGIANNADDDFRTGNAALMKFKMLVADLYKIAPGVVKIDFTRTLEAKTKVKEPGQNNWQVIDEKKVWAWPNNPANKWLDVPNDDANPTSSDVDLMYRDGTTEKVTQFLYSYDGPGIARAPAGVAAGSVDAWMDQFNAWEFVRIKIGSSFEDGVNGTADAVQRSRASEHLLWHHRLHVTAAGQNPNKTFQRAGVAADNEIDTDHKAITV
jgi:hypothetical protein